MKDTDAPEPKSGPSGHAEMFPYGEQTGDPENLHPQGERPDSKPVTLERELVVQGG